MCKEDKRGVAFFSHHQPFSDFITDEAYVGASKQLAEMIDPECSFLWFTGHEHSFNVYNKSVSYDGINLSMYTRLVGNGGFPQSPQEPSKHTILQAYDNRVYKEFQLNGGKSESYVFNGYFTIVLEGPEMKLEYRTVQCDGGGSTTCEVATGPSFTESTLLLAETFRVDGETGNVVLEDQTFDETLMTMVDPENIYILPEEKRKKRQRRAFEDLFSGENADL